MNREDFIMFNQDIIYFDNAATTFKPRSVINATTSYYEKYSVSAHRSDYKLSHMVDEMYESVRVKVRKFINARLNSEIVFTSGATESINMIVKGYLKHKLKAGDEILVTKSEHASVLLPVFNLANELDLRVRYIPLDSDFKVSDANVRKAITSKTKAIIIAHITNVIGDIRPIKEICEIASMNNIITVIDGAQSVPHSIVNMVDLNCDFYVFSGHKVYGPTGVGILYGKHKLLNELVPLKFGGGMNTMFHSNGEIEYQELPEKLEAGTQNIAGILGLGAALDYVSGIGMYKIEQYEQELGRYLVDNLADVPNIIIYNKNPDSSIITFNIESIFSQDLACYLDRHNICVRAGSHCAKILKDDIGIKNTCRISLSFYNTKEEVDKLVSVLKNKNILRELI